MSGSDSLNDDFRDMLRALLEEGVAFVVVGAHAMGAHGVPRATGDLDLFVDPGHENAGRAIAALRRFGAPLSAHGITVESLQRPGTVYQIGLPPRRIDLLTSIDGVTFEQAWATHVVVPVDHLQVPFLGREALLANKRATGREKDRLDVELLERIGRGDV